MDSIGTNDLLPTGTERILIVDDERVIVKMTKAMLDLLGYQVSTTTESIDALEKIRTDPDQFDLERCIQTQGLHRVLSLGALIHLALMFCHNTD